MYNISAGHNPSGKIACGAVGLLDESKEARLITNEIIKLLRLNGHKTYNCTVSNGKNQRDILIKICTKHNKRKAIYDISVHLNSGRNDKKGDKKIGGFEIWITNPTKDKKNVSGRIRKQMKELGFTDRGTKTTNSLYFLNHTKSPSLLLEICFVDDKDDYKLYKEKGYKEIAIAIVKGLLNKENIYKQRKVQIISKTLKIREGAGLTKKKVGTALKGEKYTITNILYADGIMWGKIKNKKQYISLNQKYVKYVD